MSPKPLSRRTLLRAAPVAALAAAAPALAADQRDDAPAVAPLAAFTRNARILFQGDSITDGNRGRSADPNHILGHGYVFIIAAKYGAAFPELRLDFVNRGVSGNTVLELEKRWKADTLDLKPDLLSVMIGINDCSRKVPLEQYEQTYDKLLTEARAANPDLRLVLIEPFTLPSGRKQNEYDTWSQNVARYAQLTAKLAAKHKAALVSLQKTFDAATKLAPADYWIWDGVHPTYRGHQLIADQWVAAVRRMGEHGK